MGERRGAGGADRGAERGGGSKMGRTGRRKKYKILKSCNNVHSSGTSVILPIFNVLKEIKIKTTSPFLPSFHPILSSLFPLFLLSFLSSFPFLPSFPPTYNEVRGMLDHSVGRLCQSSGNKFLQLLRPRKKRQTRHKGGTKRTFVLKKRKMEPYNVSRGKVDNATNSEVVVPISTGD
jgi:hypothetical protein